jgi:hypothetical protein
MWLVHSQIIFATYFEAAAAQVSRSVGNCRVCVVLVPRLAV